MKNQKGITLVALIITIAVLLIIAIISIGSGTDSLDNTRLQGFYAQLEIVQKRVDDIAATNESYINSYGETVYLKEQGITFENLDTTKQETLQKILIAEGMETKLDMTNFRYFTKAELENILDLSEIDYNMFIDFENRIVIAEEGITIKDQTYYMLENSTYLVEQDTNKNVGTIEGLEYNIIKYGDIGYKITITPTNSVGDLKIEGTLKYKKTTSKYWETSTKLEMVISQLGDYNIIYEDINKNSVTKTIRVGLNDENIPTVTEL